MFLWIEVYKKNSLGKHIYMICVVYIQIKNWQKILDVFLKRPDDGKI